MLKAAPSAAFVTLLTWACAPTADEATAYGYCRDAGNACRDSTRCTTVACCSTTLCTVPCAEDADCPARPGFTPVCETFMTGRFCAIACAGEGAQCPDDFVCRSESRLDGTEVWLCL